MSKFRSAALVCVVFVVAPVQGAAGIWRCGNSYSDQPCANGRPIETDEAPSVERRRQADAAARRDMQAADRMQRERQRFEAEQSQRRPLLIGPAPPREAPPASKPGTKKKKDKKEFKASDAFVASYPNPDAKDKKKKKAKAAVEGDQGGP